MKRCRVLDAVPGNPLRSTKRNVKGLRVKAVTSIMLLFFMLTLSVQAFSSSSSSSNTDGLLRIMAYRNSRTKRTEYQEKIQFTVLYAQQQNGPQQQQYQVETDYVDVNDDDEFHQLTTKVLVAAMDDWKATMMFNEHANNDDIATISNWPRNWVDVKAWSLLESSLSSFATTPTTNSSSIYSKSNNTNNNNNHLPRNWALVQDFAIMEKAHQHSSSSTTTTTTTTTTKDTADLNVGTAAIPKQPPEKLETTTTTLPPKQQQEILPLSPVVTSSSSSSTATSSSMESIDDEHIVSGRMEQPVVSSFSNENTTAMATTTTSAVVVSEEINAIGFTVAAGILWWSMFNLDSVDELTWQRALLAASATSYFVPGPIGRVARVVGNILYEAALSVYRERSSEREMIRQQSSTPDDTQAMPLFFAAATKDIGDSKPEEENVNSARDDIFETEIVAAAAAAAAAPFFALEKSVVPTAPGVESREAANDSGVDREAQSIATRKVAAEKQKEMNRRALLRYRLTLEVIDQKQRAAVQQVEKSISTVLSAARDTGTVSAAAQLEQIYSILKAVPSEVDIKQVGETSAKLEKISAVLESRKASIRNSKAASEAQLEQISAILAPRAPRTVSINVAAPETVVYQDIKKDEAVTPTRKSWEESSKQNELTRRSLLEYRLQLQAQERTQCIKEREALEASKQNELTQRSLLHYRLTLQADERVQRGRAQAQEESKRKELAWRSMLGYRLEQQADERTRRAQAQALEESKQKALETSRQHELTRRTMLEYRLKLQAEERAQRAITDALESSKQNEWTRRTMLEYRLKLQAEERTQRANTDALESSKQNEWTRRTILEYRLKLQAEERSQRAIAEALEASKQKALVVSIRNELARRSLLAYRLKLQSEERTQRAITEALKVSKRIELTRRSLLEYRLTLQSTEQMLRVKAAEEAKVPTTTAPEAQLTEQTSPSTSADFEQRIPQKQEPRQVEVPVPENGQATANNRITTLGGTNASFLSKDISQNVVEAKGEIAVVEKSDSYVSYQRQSEHPSAVLNIEENDEPSSVATKKSETTPLDAASLKQINSQDKASAVADPIREDLASPESRAPQAGEINDVNQKRAETKKPAVQDAVGVNGGPTMKKTITSMSWKESQKTALDTERQVSIIGRGPGKDKPKKDGAAVQSSFKPVVSASQDQRVTQQKTPIDGADPLQSDATDVMPSEQNTVDSDQNELIDDEAKKPIASTEKGIQAKAVVATEDSPKPIAQLIDSDQDKGVLTKDPSHQIHTAALLDDKVKNQGDGKGVAAQQNEPKLESSSSPSRSIATLPLNHDSKQGESFERPKLATPARPGEGIEQEVQPSAPMKASDPDHLPMKPVQQQKTQQRQPPVTTFEIPSGATAATASVPTNQVKLAPEQPQQPIAVAVVATQKGFDSMSSSQQHSLQPPTDSDKDRLTTELPTKPATAKPVNIIPQRTVIPAMTTAARKVDPNPYRSIPLNPVQQQPQQQQQLQQQQPQQQQPQQQQQAPPVAATKLYSPHGSAPTVSESNNQGELASAQQKVPTATFVAPKDGNSTSSTPQQHAAVPLPNGSSQGYLVAQSSPQRPTDTRLVQGMPQSAQSRIAMTTALPQIVGPKQEIFNMASLVQPKQPRPPSAAQPIAIDRWPTVTTRRKRRVTPSVEGSTSRILQQQPQSQQKPPLSSPNALAPEATRRTSSRTSRALRLDTFDDDWKNIVGIKPLQPQSQQQQPQSQQTQQRQRQRQQQNPLSSQMFTSLSSAEGILSNTPFAAAGRPVEPSHSSIGNDTKDPSDATTETKSPLSSTQTPQEQVTVRAASSSPPPAAAAAAPPPSQQRQRVVTRQQQQPASSSYQNRWWDI